MNHTTESTNLLHVLHLTDSNLCITDVKEEGSDLIVIVQKENPENICPECGHKMESKGPRIRKINHPILQDGRRCYINLKTWKWHCLNCNTYHYDQFYFVDKFKQSSKLTDLMVLDKLKDLNNTCVSVGKELNISDTLVHEIFMRYVDLPRLPLGEVLNIDEVYMHFNPKNLYSVVLLDWKTGDVIDILKNRFTSTLEKYFSQIPLAERSKVKFLISDMYSPYTSLAGTTFPNAVSIIDTFHHTQPLINAINTYVTNVRKKYMKRDQERLKEKNYRTNSNHKMIKESHDVYLLRKYDFLMTKNLKDIDYTPYYRSIHGRGGYWFSLENIEKEFMELDPNFRKIRELKEMYIAFTHSHINQPEAAAADLNQLIQVYEASGIYIFTNFAELLKRNKDGIIASFTFMKTERISANDETLHRLSNGPMESYNNQPKDLKRVSNGVQNFQYTRNRLLWASRKNPSIKGVPYTREEIHTTGRQRGPYKKK